MAHATLSQRFDLLHQLAILFFELAILLDQLIDFFKDISSVLNVPLGIVFLISRALSVRGTRTTHYGEQYQ
jgi:hypothetical protein